MAAQSTLRDRLPALLARYFLILRNNKSSRQLLSAAVLCVFVVGGYARRRQRKQAEEQKRGRELVRRNSGILGKDGEYIIYVPHPSHGTTKVVIKPTKKTTFDAHRRLFLSGPGGRDQGSRLP